VPERNAPSIYVFYYLAFGAVVARTIAYAATQGEPLSRFVLLGVFLLLGLLLPVLARRSRPLFVACLVLQSALTVALLLIRPARDYFAMLFIALSLAVAGHLPLRSVAYWLGGFCVLATVALFVAFHWSSEGLTYIPIYIGAILLIGLYGRANRVAEEARLRSEGLLGQLQETNRRLKVYAERAEEVAAAQERTRMARELHDAVTQTVFSMNLTAEAARLACSRTPERVPAMLDRLQELAKEALTEMRSLVEELRPRAVAEVGLRRSLEKHLAMRRRRDQLEVTLEVAGEERGDAALKEALFRTAQEALNNVLRHAGVRTAAVQLLFGEEAVVLRVRDRGCGFVPGQASGGESFGLINMRERVEAVGGEFHLRTATGDGTEIEARVPLGGGGQG
jgi:signal transduction histidine kinase